MSNRVERLRRWLLGSAVLLALVIAAFIGSASYLRRHFLAGLPARLGVNIVRETDGWTYCPSDKARTEYCIHAAKALEHKDGKIALHDVWIALYGKRGERNDRIYGDEFEYDKNEKVVRATGVVHIDLQTAEAGAQAGGEGVAGKAATSAGKAGAAANAKVIHVTTSGLVYLEKLGLAATSQPIEFQSGGLTGHAVGADYVNDSGMLMLHSAVTLSSISGARPLAITASTAEFDQRNQQARLTGWTYESEGRKGAGAAATLYRRQDGTLSRVDAKGNVRMEAKGAKVIAQHADIALTADSQPQTAVLTGDVTYMADQTLRQVRGEAGQATIDFDAEDKPQPQHVVLTGAVHLTERTRATDRPKEPWSAQDLVAERVEGSLAQVGGTAQLRDATATGNPRLTQVNRGSLASSKGAGTSEMSADTLTAHLVPGRDAGQTPEVDTIAGRGHTVLSQTTEAGLAQTVAADSLDAKLRPGAGARPLGGLAKEKTAGGRSEDTLAALLWSAVEQGHVTIMRRIPAKTTVPGLNGAGQAAAADEVQHFLADRAVYDGDLDRMILTAGISSSGGRMGGIETGGVQMTQGGSMLWANQVVLDHKTGDSSATGAVKVNYAADATGGRAGSGAGAGSSEPTHVLADRAELAHASNVTTFYGRPVRVWQGGSQVKAPVIEFSKDGLRLVARGDGSAAGQVWPVETVLAAATDGGAAQGTGKAGAAKTGAATPGCPTAPGATAEAAGVGRGMGRGVQLGRAMRIASGGLVYAGNTGQADFTGGFRADTVDGTIRAAQGTVYLRQVAAGSKAAAVGSKAAAESGKSAAAGGNAAGGRKAGSDGGAAVPSFAGELDRVVAAGRVELVKPGLKASGERLVYTASDRTALLTGDEKRPPKAVDAQGTTTGEALVLHSACDGAGGGSVEVVASPGQRVHTDARISDARTGGTRTDAKLGGEGKKQKGQR